MVVGAVPLCTRTHTVERDSILVDSMRAAQGCVSCVLSRQPTLYVYVNARTRTHVPSYSSKPRVYCRNDATSTREPDAILYRDFDVGRRASGRDTCDTRSVYLPGHLFRDE